MRLINNRSICPSVCVFVRTRAAEATLKHLLRICPPRHVQRDSPSQREALLMQAASIDSHPETQGIQSQRPGPAIPRGPEELCIHVPEEKTNPAPLNKCYI